MSKLQANKIERVFVKDEAYHILEENIINGTLKPNTRLRINQLSHSLGISRTPIREAILKLEDEGLVLSKANQWTIVAPIRIDAIRDIYPLVYLLESYCLNEGFDRVDEDLIQEMKRINEKIEEYNESRRQLEVIELDNAFHDQLVRLSDNKEIKPILDKLKKRIRRLEILFYTSKSTEKPTSTYMEHLDLIHALEERNLEKALVCLKINWANVLDKQSLAGLKNMEEYKDYFA